MNFKEKELMRNALCILKVLHKAKLEEIKSLNEDIKRIEEEMKK